VFHASECEPPMSSSAEGWASFVMSRPVIDVSLIRIALLGLGEITHGSGVGDCRRVCEPHDGVGTMNPRVGNPSRTASGFSGRSQPMRGTAFTHIPTHILTTKPRLLTLFSTPPARTRGEGLSAQPPRRLVSNATARSNPVRDSQRAADRLRRSTSSFRRAAPRSASPARSQAPSKRPLRTSKRHRQRTRASNRLHSEPSTPSWPSPFVMSMSHNGPLASS
jgi:hypothetical protein